jgi:hypothetical protein
LTTTSICGVRQSATGPSDENFGLLDYESMKILACDDHLVLLDLLERHPIPKECSNSKKMTACDGGRRGKE